MSIITLNLPDDIEQELSSLEIKKEEFILNALKEKINSYKNFSFETLLTEGYKLNHSENELIGKEFLQSDLETGMNIKRGNVYLANLDPTIGSEISKRRPVIVVSNNINNDFNNTVTIIPVTSSTTKIYPFEIFIKANIANLPKDSKAKADQIRTIDKTRLVKEIGRLPEELIPQLENAIKVHLKLL